MIQRIIDDVRKGLLNKCYHLSLFTALTIPDICVAMQYGSTSGKAYSAWWNENLPDYKDYLSGEDCYALRCAILHKGKDNLSEQRMRKVLDYCIFITSGGHLSVFKDVIIHDKEQSFLRLNVERFCEDICCAAESWMKENSSNLELDKRMKQGVEIHDAGYVHLGLIKFS